MEKTIFHNGERAVQELAGEEKMAKRVGRVIQESIQFGAMDFMMNQPFLVIASLDKDGRPWSSILFGEKGFIKVQGTKTFTISLNKLLSSASDIFFKNIQENNSIGTLFIDHGLRIRYRVNGTILQTGNLLTITVNEAYGNCPKYIQAAMISAPMDIQGTSKITKGVSLQPSHLKTIKNAHTFYLATSSKNGFMDSSHRGGKKGFVEVLEDNILRIPDYPGNSMFNSLGNIYENPLTGITLIDFNAGTTLQLSGTGELLFNQTDAALSQDSGNTGRYWLFKTEKWVQTENHHAISYKFLDYSPYNP